MTFFIVVINDTMQCWHVLFVTTIIYVRNAIPDVINLCFIRLVPESPGWLLAKGRVSEATSVIKKMAKTNNTSLNSALLKR